MQIFLTNFFFYTLTCIARFCLTRFFGCHKKRVRQGIPVCFFVLSLFIMWNHNFISTPFMFLTFIMILVHINSEKKFQVCIFRQWQNDLVFWSDRHKKWSQIRSGSVIWLKNDPQSYHNLIFFSKIIPISGTLPVQFLKINT